MNLQSAAAEVAVRVLQSKKKTVSFLLLLVRHLLLEAMHLLLEAIYCVWRRCQFSISRRVFWLR